MITVIIPTYNERENIEKLIPEIFKVLKNHKLEVIVVDDNSPDGTAGVVRKLAKRYNVRLFERKKKLGIGSAYKFGFKKARGNVVFEMDADFSHDPRSLPAFIEKINEGYDAVIGSRYIKGGERNDPFHRRIFPIIGNILYTKVLGFPIKDTTAGYRAYRKEIIDKLPLQDLPNDFSFQAAILFKLMRENAKMTEVPIKFGKRLAGKPKYSAMDLLGNIKLLMVLFFKRWFS